MVLQCLAGRVRGASFTAFMGMGNWMGRLVALVIALLALTVFAVDLSTGPGSGEALRLSALGEWWFWAHPNSLQLMQPALERHVSPLLWDPVMLTLLEGSLAIELGILAAVVWLGARPWQRTRKSPPLDLTKK